MLTLKRTAVFGLSLMTIVFAACSGDSQNTGNIPTNQPPVTTGMPGQVMQCSESYADQTLTFTAGPNPSAVLNDQEVSWGSNIQMTCQTTSQAPYLYYCIQQGASSGSPYGYYYAWIYRDDANRTFAQVFWGGIELADLSCH